MQGHTPTPWDVDPENERDARGLVIIGHQSADDMRAKLVCFAPLPPAGSINHDEDARNIALLKSAPALLEALETLLHSEESPASETTRYLARELARDVIAAARAPYVPVNQ